MKKTKKRRYLTAGRKSMPRLRILLLCILVLVTLFYFFYRLNFNQYKQLIEETLAKSLKADVSIGSLRLHFLTRHALRLQDVSITKPADGITIKAEQVVCYVGISQSMKKKEIDFSTIALINPVIKVNREKQALSEPPTTAEPKETTSSASSDVVQKVPGKKPWFAFDNVSFSIQKVSIHNGTVEVFDAYHDYVMVDTINLNSQIYENAVEYQATALIKDSDSERIWAKGDIKYPAKLSMTDMIRSFSTATVTAAFSLDTVALHSVYGLNTFLPHQIENRPFNASGDISGALESGFSITSRLSFKRENDQRFFVDLEASWQINEHIIYINRILSDFNNAGVIADGYYEFNNHYGELYIQSNSMRVEREKELFPFLRNLDVQGIAKVSAIARFSDEIKQPSFSGTIAVESFNGKFDVLSKPLLLTAPCTGTFSTKEIVFPMADMSFGGIPLQLKLKYEFIPEPKLFLSLDKFANIQILEILEASAKQLEKSTDSVTSDKSPEPDSTPPMERNEPKPLSKPRRSRDKSSLPIYLSGYLTDAYLFKAHFESLYLDALIEGNRMLFKDVDIQLYEGSFRGNGVITFGESPSYAFVADLEDINIDTFISRNTSFKDIFYGRLSAAISFQCAGMDRDTLAGKMKSHGTLTITDGSISNFNLLTKLFEQFASDENNKYTILGSTIGLRIPPIEELELGDYSQFNSLRCDYDIHQDDKGITVFETDSLKMDSTSLKMKMAGTFDFDHRLNFEGEMLLSSVQTYKLLHKVRELNLLFPVEDERMRIPFKLRGTFEEPIPQPIIKVSAIQNKLDKLIEDKLLQKSEDIDPSLSTIELPELDEETSRKINKAQKKLKKYLE
ncbi:MAG: hypothetical protein C4541_13190 [Candidatus Auribacter fodinae]|jgi:hypothetical protein|uniref:Uncharacterized protein n=1 Tax=Candidatus Auribacter fodinae TaxID=2093366 RepID=A0A3A4QPN9_9BACT|nr:MAG: hypothetical protein C4541_13190 [Candidatus Auribacter fodinae]